jgi:hypothetical protein
LKINICLDDCQGVPGEDGVWRHHAMWDDVITEYKVVRTVRSCIAELEKNRGNVRVLTLDHDLSDTDYPNTGFAILEYLEDKVFFDGDLGICPEVVNLHSNHDTHQRKMTELAKHIARRGKFTVTMNHL